jgi:cytochrome b
MKIKVWDLPTRVFHWMLVSAYLGAFLTSREERLLEMHSVFGYLALGLTLFRVVWGFAGNPYERFSGFLKGPGRVFSYVLGALKSNPQRHIGHNPLVGWMVVFMLLVTFVMAISGIVAYSAEEGMGLFAGLFSYSTGTYASKAHHYLIYVIAFMVVTHVSAALIHDFAFKENIILAMITGVKEDEGEWAERVSGEMPSKGRPALRLAVWLIVTIMAGMGLTMLPLKMKEASFREYDGAGTKTAFPPGFEADYMVWKEECGSSCHNAFHPSLLPMESWKRVFSGLSEHFGDNASLDPKTGESILRFLSVASAEKSSTEASRKILASLREGSHPTRVTETPYWVTKHSRIAGHIYKRASVGSPSNCLACHPGAEVGSFEDKDISLPE